MEQAELLHRQTEFNHPGIAFANKERAAVLFQAIERLPENQKTAFTLHSVEDLSYQEISEVIQVSISAVESLIHRAKQNLRIWLADFYTRKG